MSALLPRRIWLRRSSALLAACAALATGVFLAVAGPGSAHTGLLPTLYVNYSMDCTFTITSDSGAIVSSIAPGAYEVQVTTPVVFDGVYVSDTTGMTACKGSAMFQLTGPGVNVQTTLDNGDEQEDLLSATFQPSATYVALDNNQPAATRYVLTTTASGTPASPTTYVTTATPAPAPDPLRGLLTATLGKTGKVTLSAKGKAAHSLPYGRYTIAVDDQSAKSGLVVRESGGAATQLSGVAFRGKRTVHLSLTVGQWSLSASPAGKRAFFDVVG